MIQAFLWRGMGVKAGPLARPEGAMALTLMKRKYPAARGWWPLFAASPRGAGEGPAAGGYRVGLPKPKLQADHSAPSTCEGAAPGAMPMPNCRPSSRAFSPSATSNHAGPLAYQQMEGALGADRRAFGVGQSCNPITTTYLGRADTQSPPDGGLKRSSTITSRSCLEECSSLSVHAGLRNRHL